MNRFSKLVLPMIALLLLQLSLVHGFQHDASHFDSAPKQNTHSETDCLLADTSPVLASAEPLAFHGLPRLATSLSFASPQARQVRYLIPPTRAPPISL
ncbi:MAG: hypothetical protein P8I95_02855 [Alphaproteobacteria bacterium]|nr:hypothetical protein [Alphaproteobacteria bacterium]